MTIVVVDLTAHAFQDTMKTMRLWLDAMHCEPSSPSPTRQRCAGRVRDTGSGASLAQRFDGKLLPRDARA